MCTVLFVSACLVGVPCRYDGRDKRNHSINNLIRDSRVLFECPESLGGMPTPRLPSEITDGDGYDVLDGTSRVKNSEGGDVTEMFIRGARRTLEIIQKEGAAKAVLKSRSPSCGLSSIKRNGEEISGSGVTAALLKRNGIEVIEI